MKKLAFPAINVAEFVAQAKKRPGEVTFASWGVGGSAHVAMEMFRGQGQFEVLCWNPYHDRWRPVGSFGTALSLAAVSSQAVQGAILLAAYALGLGVPFLVVALAWASYPGLARGLGRFGAASSRVAGLVIAALGISVATGLYSHVTSVLAQYSL